jgi:hypothetical protein
MCALGLEHIKPFKFVNGPAPTAPAAPATKTLRWQKPSAGVKTVTSTHGHETQR